MYRGLSVLLDVLLGVEHRVCIALRAFVLRWDLEAEPSLISLVGPTNTEGLKAVLPLCLRHTQLRIMRFFSQLLQGRVNVATPDFEHLVDQLQFDRTLQWLPPLPSRYILAPPTPTPVPSPVPGGGGGAGRPGGGGTGAGGSNSGTTNLQLTNVQQDSELMAAFGASGKSVRQLVGRSPESTWPKDDAGTQCICMAYALVGKCFAVCRRASTHRVLTNREKQRVQAWVTQRAASTEVAPAATA
jgi:hypothetical protein